MGWSDFRFNLPGFEDELFVNIGDSSAPHVSAYSKSRGLEIALMVDEDGATTILFTKNKDGRNHLGYIPSNHTGKTIKLDQFDPLMVRCVTIERMDSLDTIPTEVTTHDN